MSSPVTRFEVILPQIDNIAFPASADAGTNFVNSMTSLMEGGHLYLYQGFDYITQNDFLIIMGYLTSSQQTSALSLLSTLSSNIDASYLPLVCVSWSAVSEP